MLGFRAKFMPCDAVFPALNAAHGLVKFSCTVNSTLQSSPVALLLLSSGGVVFACFARHMALSLWHKRTGVKSQAAKRPFLRKQVSCCIWNQTFSKPADSPAPKPIDVPRILRLTDELGSF